MPLGLPDPLAKMLQGRVSYAMQVRKPYEESWQEVIDLIRPAGVDIIKRESDPKADYEEIADSTALQAADTFSASVKSLIFPETERNWRLRAVSRDKNILEEDISLEDRTFIDNISDRIHLSYTNRKSRLSESLHELAYDLIVGTGCLFQWWDKRAQMPRFRVIPLADTFIDENEAGDIDTFYIRRQLSTRDVLRRFGDGAPEKVIKEKDQNRIWNLWRLVFPSDDRELKDHPASVERKEFASFWLFEDLGEAIETKGYRVSPYHVGRWGVVPGEMYGRGVGIKMLGTVQSLNFSMAMLLKRASFSNFPPLDIPMGVYEKIDFVPGGKLLRSSIFGDDRISPIQMGSEMPVTRDIILDLRNDVKSGFMVDLFQLGKQGVEMTATEVASRRAEDFRGLIPFGGRLENEVLNTMVIRTYEYMKDFGVIPNFPESFKNRSITVGITSTAEMAQRTERVVKNLQFIDILLKLASINPSAVDVVNIDHVTTSIALDSGIDSDSVNSPEEIAQSRADRQQQSVLSEFPQQAKQLGQAAKQFAQADAIG